MRAVQQGAGRCMRNKSVCGRAIAVPADVADPEQTEEIVESALDQFGRVDILVNNAGVTHPAQSILDLDLDLLDRVFAVDFKGVYLCSRAGGRAMLAKGGVILNISSIAGLTPLPLPVYGPMKSAVNMLTRILAREWAACGIRVNAIAPGYFKTEMTRALYEDEKFDAWLCSRVPANRWGDPAELVGAAVFLAARASDYVNGHLIYVDGGLTLR